MLLTYSTFIVAPLFDFVIVIEQRGTVSDRPRSGRLKVTTQHEDRYIAVALARRRFVDGPSLERMLRQQRRQGARRISVQTVHVRNRVRASGFRKPAKKSQLSQRHSTLRRQFVHDTADGIGSNGHESFSLMNPGLSAKGG